VKRVVAQDTKGEGKRIAEEERSGEERSGVDRRGEGGEEKRRKERRGEERRRGAKAGTVEERPKAGRGQGETTP
jgi:hypothetical protein